MPVCLGDRIRDARKAAGLTQRQLADKIKVSNTSISNWENGVSCPDPDTIQNLCWALNVQPNYFFALGYPPRVPEYRASACAYDSESSRRQPPILAENTAEPVLNPEHKIGRLITRDSRGSHNAIYLAGRDGSYQRRILTDDQLAALSAILDQMPDASEDL